MKNRKLRVASLFSGIGGFEEGFSMGNLEYELVFASEIDKFAQYTYRSKYGDSVLYGDIRSIDESSIPDHDLLCAGFPCQAFSITGKRAGFDDTRGTLFFEIARILKEKKPKYILLENVKNLVSHDRQRTIYTILHILNEIGYTLDFSVVNSSEAGLPQNRERTYIFGIYSGPKEFYKKDYRNNKVDEIKQNLNMKYFNSTNFFEKLKFNSEKKYIIDIIDNNVDKKYFLHSKNIDEFVRSSINERYDETRKHEIIKLFDLPKSIHNDLERQRRVYSVFGIAPTLLARSDSPKLLIGNKIRKMTPKETLRAQGFSSETIELMCRIGLSDTQLYKQSGNAVSPPVIEGITKLLKEMIKNE